MDRAVDEFRILTRSLGIRPDSPAKASRGRAPGQGWHGRVYENLRNDMLDAVPHEIVQNGGTKGLLRRNQFGFNVAGPVVLPRLRPNTYFSISYEGVRERISRTYLQTIPTMPQRIGDFSAVVDQAGNSLPVFDPATTRPNPDYSPSQPVSQGNLQYNRDPFPGNRIPTSRLDPVAQRAAALYPAPNTAIGPFFQNNYFINSPETNTANGMIGKLDQTLGDRHRLTLELNFSNGLLGSAHWFPSAADPGASDRTFASRSVDAEHVFTLSSRTVNTATFSASSQSSQTEPGVSGGLFAGETVFPVIGFSPYLNMGHAYPVGRTARNTYSLTDALSTTAGRHNLRFVGSYYQYQVNTFSAVFPSGGVWFSQGLTSLPGIINTGDAFASFVLGLPEYAQRTVVTSPSYFRRSHAGFAFRDRYEARKGLTITLGLGLYCNTPRTEKYDRQSTVDLSAVNPATGVHGMLVAANRDGYGRAFQPVQVNLSPSAGIAWNPRGNPATVVRLSFARSYGSPHIYNGQWGTQGFSASPTYISPNVQLQPALVLADGFPPLGTPLPNLSPGAADLTVADLINTTGNQATYQSASFSVERQVTASLVATAGFSYSGGKNLLVGNEAANPNAIPLQYLSYRDQLNDENFNASLRPYPQYKGFDVYYGWPLGRYQRDSAFLRLEKRASKGLSVSASYEFARQMDDYSGPYGKQDFFNRQNEWSRTVGVPPQSLQLSYVYELPLGAALPGPKRLTDGWSVSGMAAISAGGPLFLHPQFNNTGGVVQALRVNTVPGVDPRVANPGPGLWYNPAAFDQPADFTLGDASRTLDLFNPGHQNYDVSLNKRIPLAPDRTVEFSAAGFNFINHANWNEPDNVIGPASAPNVNAGKIIGSHGGRVIQVGLRFSF